MPDPRSLLERESRRFIQPDGAFERLVHRGNRKRRNQRITAGVLGIAIFVAAVWIVRDMASLYRTDEAVVPAGDVTGPADTESTFTQPGTDGHLAPGESFGPAQTAPASGEPDVVRQEECSGDARSRLELTKVGHRPPDQVVIRVRYKVYRSPVGHEWRIAIHPSGGKGSSQIFRGIRVASDSGRWAVQLRVLGDGNLPSRFIRFTATAVDTQTGQVCTVDAGF